MWCQCRLCVTVFVSVPPPLMHGYARTHACLVYLCLVFLCLVYLCLCLCLVYLCLCLVYLCLYLVYFERKRKIRECRVYFREFFTGATENLINRYLNYRFLHTIWPPAFPIICIEIFRIFLLSFYSKKL